MRFMATLDMYRKVPADLMEGTRRGKLFSIFAVFAMATLFIYETTAFFSTESITEMSMDRSEDKRIRVSFNVTMMDLGCDFVVIDAVSPLGTEQNITQHVMKWEVDAEGLRQRFNGRNKFQRDIVLVDSSVQEDIEDLLDDGEDAVSLDAELLDIALKENMFVFVMFYANWCSHCHDLLPTWETLAEIMTEVAYEKVDAKYNHTPEISNEEFHDALKLNYPVLVAKVDCVEHPELCVEQGIRAYPTLRLFVDSKKYGADYRDDRTVEAFTRFLATVEKEVTESDEGSTEAERMARMRVDKPTDHQWRKDRVMHKHWQVEQHKGCQVSGYLFLDRVPGSFHIMARSRGHDLDPRWTNVSHEIHSMQFGEPWMSKQLENSHDVPNDLTSKLSPLNGNVYITHELHQAYHHHIKIIPHSFDYNVKRRTEWYKNEGRVYQLLSQSQLSEYHYDSIPEAKFFYDLSPVAISYRRTSRKWYDYLTSIMAIVGGTFTLVGMLESSVHTIATKKRS